VNNQPTSGNMDNQQLWVKPVQWVPKKPKK
jgi:hypothetical protein